MIDERQPTDARRPTQARQPTDASRLTDARRPADARRPTEATPHAPMAPATLAVWAGENDSSASRTDLTANGYGATQVPIVYSAAYGYDDVDTWLDVALGKKEGHIYSRNTNPTVAVFEEKIRQLEGAAAATSFSTGMAAISQTLFALLSPGDRVVSIKDTYGGTNRLFQEFLPRLNIPVTLCETTDAEQILAAVAEGCTMLYLETPTNPTLKIVDIARLAAAAHEVGALVVVDNTFATPMNQHPLALGADLVIHSATKFLGGHADALGGAVCGEAALVERIFHYREITGASLDPMAAYLLVRGMKTLALRISRQNESALRIAQWLQTRSAVTAVYYPGLETHPQHEVARRQMSGYGGVLSFMLSGGFPAVQRVLARLRLAHLAANLGAVETVAGPPATTSHVECTAEERAAMGIPEGLIRYSVGIEDPNDLIADLEQALSAV